jgi:chromosome partitioning protein
MPVFMVANPKGGVGKSTLATNLAGYLAHQGHPVMVGDLDVQQSTRQWLSQRPTSLPRIQGWELSKADGKTLAKPPKGVTHVVLDTPAGLHGKRLTAAFGMADRILVPLQPSLFDIQATHAFLQTLQSLRAESGRKPSVGLVAMRARDGTLSVQQLQQFLSGLEVPVLGTLRDTQNYVQLAARGLTLWDVAPSRVERDLAQWEGLLDWLNA